MNKLSNISQDDQTRAGFELGTQRVTVQHATISNIQEYYKNNAFRTLHQTPNIASRQIAMIMATPIEVTE